MNWSETLTQHLPAGLSMDDLRVVIAEHADPMAWPGPEPYMDANLPAACARLIVKAWHPELQGARFAHLYRQKLGGTDPCRVIGRAKKAGPELVHLAQVDFIITYSFTAWIGLEWHQRLALIDHELSHCGKDVDGAGWVTVPHDLAEFGNVVRRWGPWHDGITAFQHQLELFAR